MRTLSRSAQFLIAVALLVVSSPVVKAQTTTERQVIVTIMVYSGRPDPSFVLDSSDLERLKTVLAKPRNTPAEQASIIPSKLGYKGILVENPGGIEGLPPSFVIYNGNAQITGEKRVLYEDAERSTETLLVNRAIAAKVIDQHLMKKANLKLDSSSASPR